MAYGDLKVNNLIYDTGSGDASRSVVSIPQTASPTFTGNITINAQGDFRFADSDSSNYVGFQAPATVSSNVVWTLPAADGTNGQQLSTNGSGVLSWTDATNVAAASLSGTTMASNVVTSSLTSLGTLTGLTINGDVTFTGASSNGLWDKSANAFVANLTGDVTGDLTGTADVATAVTVADESSDTTCFPLFTTAATGNLPPKSGSNLKFNSSNGELEAVILKDGKGDVRDIPENDQSGAYTLVVGDEGKVVANSTGGWTVPASVFSAGSIVTVLNKSGSAQNITASALTYLYNTADGANIKANTIALGARGMATIWFSASNTGYIQSAALTVS